MRAAHLGLCVVALSLLVPRWSWAQSLHHAVSSANRDQVGALLRNRPALVDERDEDGRTALHIAARRGLFEIARVLVNGGATVDARDNSGQAPLHLAAFHGHGAIVALLIGGHADLDAADSRSLTPLHYAVFRDNAQVVTILLESGADVNRQDAEAHSPFFYAAFNKQTRLVDLMLGFNPALPSDAEGLGKLLEKAAEAGDERLTQLLLDRGADPSHPNSNGGSLLHSAARGGLHRLLARLIRDGANLDTPDRYGLTPLHLAALEGHAQIVTLLLDAGAAVDPHDGAGRTPLYLAIERHHRAAAALLLRRKAASTNSQHTDLAGRYLGQAMPDTRPALFAPGVVSSMYWEHSSPTFTPDGSEVFWCSITDRAVLYRSALEGGRWTVPSVPPFVTEHDEIYPRLSQDGNRLYFGSRRPVAKGRPDNALRIWYVDRVYGGWNEPTVVRIPEVSEDVYGFSVAANGTLYFTLGAGSSFDLYRSRLGERGYTSPERLSDLVNSLHHEDGPFIAPDESYLLFESIRPDGYGGADLYASFRQPDGSWSKAVSLGEAVNTAAAERFPYVTPDGRYLFFGSDRNWNRGDVYWVSADVIRALRSDNR